MSRVLVLEDELGFQTLLTEVLGGAGHEVVSAQSGAAALEPGRPRLSKLTLPVRLALLVTGTMLPLIVFAVGIAVYNYKQDRNDATRRVLENVRSMRLVLDSEVQRMTGGLQVLALTNSLRDDDF